MTLNQDILITWLAQSHTKILGRVRGENQKSWILILVLWPPWEVYLILHSTRADQWGKHDAHIHAYVYRYMCVWHPNLPVTGELTGLVSDGWGMIKLIINQLLKETRWMLSWKYTCSSSFCKVKHGDLLHWRKEILRSLYLLFLMQVSIWDRIPFIS